MSGAICSLHGVQLGYRYAGKDPPLCAVPSPDGGMCHRRLDLIDPDLEYPRVGSVYRNRTTRAFVEVTKVDPSCYAVDYLHLDGIGGESSLYLHHFYGLFEHVQ